MSINNGNCVEETQENNEDLTKQNGTCFRDFITCRWVIAIVCSLGFLNVYALRVNLSMAMVAMVNSSYTNKSQIGDECPGHNTSNHDNNQQGEFDWNANLQGLILGAFFYGYIITQIPGGVLAERFGGKFLFGLGVLCTSVFTLLTEVAARASPWVLFTVRFAEGVGEGVTFPAMHALLSKWSPPLERSILGTLVYAGAHMGTVVSMASSGVIADKLGWPAIFYIFGSIGCVWFIFYVFLVYNSPAEHPRISQEERKYIEESIGSGNKTYMPFPLKSVATSVPFLALIVAHTCHNWAFYTLLTSLPTFMSDVLHFDLSQNGFLSSLPYVTLFVVMIIGGQIADLLRKKSIMSTTNVRKLFCSAGLLIPAISLCIVGYLGCNSLLTVIMIVIAAGSDGLSQSGYGINHLDLAPSFAGTLMGITNTVATLPGFLGPQVVGILTNNQPTQEQWRKVFFISAGINVVGAVIYLIFASGEEQPWAKVEGMEDLVIQGKKNKIHIADEYRALLADETDDDDDLLEDLEHQS